MKQLKKQSGASRIVESCVLDLYDDSASSDT